MTDSRMIAAQERMAMRSTAETRMPNEGQANAGGLRRLDDGGNPYYDPAPLSEYPRMLYRKTDTEQIQEAAEMIAELKDKPVVINRFDGLLCDMCIANSMTEAEALAELGWETSPKAAHGITDGIGKVVSAKDERIAELEAMLAAQSETPRRGRPPKSDDL